MFCLTAAVKARFPEATDRQIMDWMGTFLAQSGDREGGRKNWLSGAAQQPTSEEMNTEESQEIDTTEN